MLQCAVALIFVFTSISSEIQAASRSIEKRFDSFYQFEVKSPSLPYKEKAVLISQKYDELFAPRHDIRSFKEVRDVELDMLFRAAYLTAFYTFDAKHVMDMKRVLVELEKRGIASDRHRLDMYQSLVAARMLTEARAFSQKFPTPTMENLPALREEAGIRRSEPTEWALIADASELLRQPVHLDQAVQILIVSHPLCHFSQNAVRDIYSDPLLRAVFIGRTKWLAPQSGTLDIKVFQQWNREHPEAQMTFAYKQDEWPMIDYWGTPSFYFFKNGKVAAKVVGWPKGGQRAELLAALRQVGLTQSAK